MKKTTERNVFSKGDGDKLKIQDGIKDIFTVLSELTDNYLYISDMKTGVFLYSPQLVEIFQLPSNILKNPLPVWKEIVHPEDWEEFEKANTGIGKNGNNYHSIYFRAKAFDGEYVLMKCRGKVVFDDGGEPFIFTGIMTELGFANKRGSLSSIQTRKRLNKILDEKCLNSSLSEQFAVIEIDIDNMEQLNAMYSRKTGDFIIQEVYNILTDVLKDKGKVYKLEANCFCVVIDTVTENDIASLFSEIQNEIDSVMSQYLSTESIHVSAGCTFYTDDVSNRDTLLRSCDVALRYAKNNSKNHLTFYDNSMWEREKRKYLMNTLLEKSSKRKFPDFYLQYQPLILADSQKIHGVEALLRWNCPELGAVSPVEFIPALEQNGLIVPLGLAVFRQAIKDGKKYLAYSPDFYMSVNVSVKQITQSDFAEEISRIIEEEQFPPENIVLELTESCIVENIDEFNSTLQKLKLLGLKIAIDDFGTGYSSLGLLKNLHVDYLKLDKLFIRDIMHSLESKMFIKTVIEFAHFIGYKVLQEGVETEEEFNEIKPLGIDYIQGYLFGRPQNAEQITEKLCRAM